MGQDTVGTDPHTTYQHGPGQIRDTQNDYKKFIPRMSNGLTIKGTEYINQSNRGTSLCNPWSTS